MAEGGTFATVGFRETDSAKRPFTELKSLLPKSATRSFKQSGSSIASTLKEQLSCLRPEKTCNLSAI